MAIRTDLQESDGSSVIDAEHRPQTTLHCLICNRPFDFEKSVAAVIVRHVSYGYDFVHEGACLEAVAQWLFPEPGFDCAAFGPDVERRRILGATSARGWDAALQAGPEEILRGFSVRLDPLDSWVLVEHAGGAVRLEGLTRDEEWADEPGTFEFPEAQRGSHAFLGYLSPALGMSPMLVRLEHHEQAELTDRQASIPAREIGLGHEPPILRHSARSLTRHPVNT